MMIMNSELENRWKVAFVVQFNVQSLLNNELEHAEGSGRGPVLTTESIYQ
jgi:hypothetical protein